MERRNLEYFLAVVENGGFIKAAAALHVTQPALSHGIKVLERELKVSLFHRLGKGAVPTAAGLEILPAVRQILRGFANITNVANGVLGLDGGTLDVATQSTCVDDPLAAILGRMHAQHPQIRINVVGPSSATPNHVLELLDSGHAEVALIGTDHPPDNPAYVVVELHRMEFVVALPPGTTTPACGALELDDILRHGLITGPWWESSPLQTAILNTTKLNLNEHIVLRTAYRDSIIPLVAAGIGCAFIPRGSLESRGQGSVAVAECRPAMSRRTFVVRRTGPLLPIADQFIRIAQTYAGA